MPLMPVLLLLVQSSGFCLLVVAEAPAALMLCEGRLEGLEGKTADGEEEEGEREEEEEDEEEEVEEEEVGSRGGGEPL
jgi:hypothetical protein